MTSVDCAGDSLFTCPVGDGSAGYRVCRRISLSDLLRCNLRDGTTHALSTELMADHSVQYTGAVYATELEAVDCAHPGRCERVIHRASRRVRVKSNPSTGLMMADFDSDNVMFDAAVSGVTCNPREDSVRVHFSTTISAPWGRSVYVDTPVATNADGVVITASGLADPIDSARVQNPCTERTAGSVPICTQLWTAVLPSTQMTVQLMATAHVDGELLGQTPLVMNLLAAVPCNSIDLSLTGVRSNERRLADSGLVLYRDAGRTDAYVPDVSTFVDGATVYGRVISAMPSAFAAAAEFTLRLDEVHICYPFNGVASYVPYDVHHPLATGCKSPGDWMVTTLYERGGVTSDGERVLASFPAPDGLTLDFQFVVRTATTNAPIYIDVRWHVHWTSGVDARKFASDRLSQHRSAAISAGRVPDDFGEELSGFHSVLTPAQMEQTRRLPSTQRDRLRTLMALHTAAASGLSGDGLVGLYNGSQGRVRSDAVTRQYGAYNDDVWHSSGYGYYQASCPKGNDADNAWAIPLTTSGCKHCTDCAKNRPPPCVWPCDGACWPYHCENDRHDDHRHQRWLWAVPLALALLILFAFLLSGVAQRRRWYHYAASSTTVVRTPSGTAATTLAVHRASR